MDASARLVPVTLPNGARLKVEATDLGSGFEAAGFDPRQFDPVIGAIEGVAAAVQAALARARPKKASVELGLEIGVEAGQLTALLVKGGARANLKVTLHWEERAAEPAAT